MEDIKIKRAGPADVAQLQQIGKQTFAETFAATNTEANMRAYLDSRFSEEKLREELDHIHSFFYFAVSEERVLGYLKLNTGKAQTETSDDRSLEIERIYVVQECYGKGIGQLLYEQALQDAHRLQADYMWLGVWEENHRAINFYRNNGFVTFDQHIFRLGDDEQTDILMKKKLK